MAAHPGSIPHPTPHGDAPTLGSGTFCPPHGPAVAALVQLLLLLVWTAPSMCWFQPHGGCPELLPMGFAWELFLVHLSKSLAHFSHTVGLSQWSSSPSPLEPQPQRDGIPATLPTEVWEAQNTCGHPSPKVQKLGPCLEHVQLPQLLHPQSKQ